MSVQERKKILALQTWAIKWFYDMYPDYRAFANANVSLIKSVFPKTWASCLASKIANTTISVPTSDALLFDVMSKVLWALIHLL